MAHNLDITEGRASYVGAREDAWHALGTTLDHSFTAEEAMKEGLLGGWNVRKQTLAAVDEETGLVIPVEGKSAIIRTNPVNGGTDVLGVTGSNYHIIQNEEHADFLNALVDESGAHFETAGALDGGKRVFLTMKLPDHMLVGGVDKVDTYIAAVNAHDSSAAFTLMVTPVRIVCQNTLNIALGQAKNTFKIRHTRGAEKLIRSQAREALDLTFSYNDEFQKQAEQLINTTMTQSQFDEMIEREWGVPDDAAKATVTRITGKLDKMSELFADAQTQDGIRGTAWAGFNALTEWYDHFSETRGEHRDRSRAVKAIMAPEFKTRALDLTLATV